MSDPRFIQHGFDKTLAHFIEECGECLAAAGKTQRWGLSSVNPLLPPEQQETNEDWLRRELQDLRDVLDRLDAALATGEREQIVAWRCFHCGDEFTDRQDARLHFGRNEDSTPACIIKGADGGLLKALRDAEEQADDAIQAMHSESTDAAKAYHQQRCRHTQALIAAEEAGYERGLYDADHRTQSGEMEPTPDSGKAGGGVA